MSRKLDNSVAHLVCPMMLETHASLQVLSALSQVPSWSPTILVLKSRGQRGSYNSCRLIYHIAHRCVLWSTEAVRELPHHISRVFSHPLFQRVSWQANGHTLSESFKGTVEEATQSLNPIKGMSSSLHM